MFKLGAIVSAFAFGCLVAGAANATVISDVTLSSNPGHYTGLDGSGTTLAVTFSGEGSLAANRGGGDLRVCGSAAILAMPAAILTR